MARYSSKAWRNWTPQNATPARALAVPVACRVLGLDPGSLRTGYGIIDCSASGERHLASGVIRVTGADLSQRLRCIFEAVTLLVAEHQPQEIAIERVFVHRNPDSALKLGQARGVALCAAVSLGAAAHEYAPRAIKLAVSGYGGADKTQVATMITNLLTLPRAPPADAADALAVALCHAYGRRLLALGAAR
ncbi:MAG: crossover junction endodeoxyribonuclease RuvC [Steroidobacteraceae bacterium]